MKYPATGLIFAVLLFALTAVTAGNHVDATDPYDPPKLMVWIHPDQGGFALYSLCTSDPATQWLWAWGPESWETATDSAMTFTLTQTQCFFYAEEQLQWEGYFFCPSPQAVACHRRYEEAWHADPVNGNHWNLVYGKIIYDGAKWANLTDDQRRAVSAHEMGHGVGLKDHAGGMCAELTIMGQLDNPPCYQQPTFWDAIAAMDTNFYFD